MAFALRRFDQKDRRSSPWSLGIRLKVWLWFWAYLLLFRPTPKYLRDWRILILRLFGAKISGRPYVAPSARIKMPWNLTMDHRACLAPESEVYNLSMVILRSKCVVSQQAYLCCGTHDLDDPRRPLVTGDIEIGEDSFLGARVFVLPGVSIGRECVIGACSVVTKDIPDGEVWAGNPAKFIKRRELRDIGADPDKK
ncbi:MAG: DapH/DapD/GlmU-related protein [Candidatus Brocadiia bacterium]